MSFIPSWFYELNPILQALYGGLFTWGVTAIGASLVFFTRTISNKMLDGMMGFAAGVMIAATVWSLLIPSMEMAEAQGHTKWVPAAIGFLLGGVFLRICDKYLPHLHIGMPRDAAEGIETTWRRATLLVLAITLHNIPEGLAIGVLYGAAASGIDPSGTATIAAALTLTLGIAIQNFPEGVAVSMPLRREGVNMFKSFNYGQLSGIVEPISAMVGAAAVFYIQPILPYALAFAGGAMIFVVIEELVPESQDHGNTDLATMGAMIGFCVMMVLDVAFG